MEGKLSISNTEYNDNLSNLHHLDDEIKRFYSRPENQNELVERMRILKEIPDDLDTPKVLVKLGDPAKADKFVYMHDNEGKEYLIALPIDKMDYHRQIANFARKLYGKDFEVNGGGYLSVREGNLVVHGSSGSYGEFPTRVISILKEAFPNVNIVDESPAIVEKKSADKEYSDVLDSIKDPVQSELYSVVLGDLGVKMGYDSTMIPIPVEGAAGTACMIYRSENGGSFGVDTIFVATKKKDHTLDIKDVAVTRWAIHDLKARTDGDNITLDFTTDGKREILHLPIRELGNKEPYSDLSESEKAILRMYKDNQFAFKSGTKTRVLHGSAL